MNLFCKTKSREKKKNPQTKQQNKKPLLGTDEEKEFFAHRPLWTIKDAPN